MTTFIIDERIVIVRRSDRDRLSRTTFDVFEVVDGQERQLTIADPWSHEPTTQELRSFLTPRKQRLVALMARKDIEAGVDYEYVDDYELIEGTEPVGRYVAVYGDETYNQIHVTDSLQEALDCLGGIVYEEFCNVPEGVYDLDAGVMLNIKSTVTLSEGPVLSPSTQYEQALVSLAAATNAMDNAVRRLVAQKIKAVYPTAATLVTFGSYTEDGLMHANAQAILDAGRTKLAAFVDGLSDSEEWDDLTDSLDPLLHEISERDPDAYRQVTEIDLTEWKD